MDSLEDSSASVLRRRCQDVVNTGAYVANTQINRRLCRSPEVGWVLEMTRMATMLDIPEGSTRESELLVKATENPTEVIPPHIRTHVTYQPTHNRSTMIYDVQVQCY